MSLTEILPAIDKELTREELFPEEATEELTPPTNSMDVTVMISHIRQIEKQIDQYNAQDLESRRFYEERKRRCEERIQSVKGSILAFLHQNNLKNVQTPMGTAFQKTITRKQWPEDESLLRWVKEHLPQAVRIKEEPDKPTITDHLKRTGEIPDGYTETSETRLYIR